MDTLLDGEFHEGVAGVRHLVRYRGEKMYIVIHHPKCEIFVSSVLLTKDPLLAAEIDMITRLLTLAWKKNTVDDLLKQLHRSSREPKDLPGILARLIGEEFEE